MGLVFWLYASLFAYLICGDPIKLFVSLYRNYFRVICINGMVATFTQQIKTVLLQVPNEIPSLNRHIIPLPLIVR